MKKATTKAKKKHAGGRPTKYRPAMVKRVREYISGCEDEYYNYHKTQGAMSNSFDRRVLVNLPTIQGLSLFLKVNTDTIVEWGKIHKQFSVALKDLLAVQAQRLMLGGLSGDYNPMITKLILSANHGMKERVDNTTDDKPLEAPVTINNYKTLPDDELIALARNGKSGAGK